MDKQDKTAGKFAWFCLGSVFALRGIPKLIHFVYLLIIAFLLWGNISLCESFYDKYTTKERIEKVNHCPQLLDN